MTPGGDDALTVVVVDDHEMFVDSLVHLLDDEPDLSVVAVAHTAKDALLAVVHHRPAVVLLDYRLPDADAPDCIARLRVAAPGVPVLVMSGLGDDATALAAQRAGAAGVIVKTRAAHELIDALRAVASGRTEVGLSPRSRVADDGDPLSPRETEILALVADGCSNRDIAEGLHLSYNTVRNHLRNIQRKLGVHSRLEAATEGVRRSIVPAPVGRRT